MSTTTTTEENKAITRRLYEVAGTGNVELLDELTTPDIIIHGDAAFPLTQGREALKSNIQTFRTAFPDATLVIEKMFAEADRVVIHITFSGTHQGNWLGAAATGRAMRWTASAIARFADGKLAETWMIQDELGLMQQLSLVPAPGQGQQ
jgi:steroid delta-isomerase-like uncharacterized protein